MRFLLLTLLLQLSLPALSQQLVLVQGYLAQPSDWSRAGIVQQLEREGWHYSGKYGYSSEGARLYPASGNSRLHSSARRIYTVTLPTESSITTQAFYLAAYLKDIRAHFPSQKIILAGHSAGGVVARYVMVQNPKLPVSMLITIASPNLGTESAELARLVADSPLGLVAPMLGAGTLNRSQALYTDLLPESPQRFLYWLNRQAHPDVEYFSIVRDSQAAQGGDLVVSEASQSLENVYSLRYRATSYLVDGTHALSATDGSLLLDLINTVGLPRLSEVPKFQPESGNTRPLQYPV